MSALDEFLLARIAEDEHHARAARGWQTGDRHVGQPLDYSIHMDRWSPDRVLAECAAKRAIVQLHTPVDDQPDGWCNLCDGDGWPCGTMAALATVYAGHPDYDESWRP